MPRKTETGYSPTHRTPPAPNPPEPHTDSGYRGRFAPSPTGPLHIGSLYAALASFLQARAHGGEWLLRIEDIDPGRIVPGAADTILRTLKRFGLCWDGPVLYQSRRLEHYQYAIQRLDDDGLLYACTCSRKTIASTGGAGGAYPGHCRQRRLDRSHPHALRIRTTDTPVRLDDRLQGRLEQILSRWPGDFIVRRRDQAYAYQLAVVIDDHAQRITEVVRGSDLYDSTPRQIYLQQRLGLPTPDYLHVPVLVDRCGAKLSKQTHAAPVDHRHPSHSLFYLLRRLDQAPPDDLRRAPVNEILDWGIRHWDITRLPRRRTIPACLDDDAVAGDFRNNP